MMRKMMRKGRMKMMEGYEGRQELQDHPISPL